MAFRATKAEAYKDARSTATKLKRLATDTRTASAAGNISANQIVQLLNTFVTGKAELQAAASVPGMAAYAKAQEGDPDYDVAGEFAAMIDACTAIINNIVTSISPGGAHAQTEIWSSSGVSVRTFTPAQTASLRTALSTFEGTIE